MKTAYRIYRVGQPPEDGVIDWPSEPGFRQIAELVEPLLGENEPLEHVSVLYQGERRDMFVCEHGHMELRHRHQLPINDAATAIYRNHWLTKHPETDPGSLPEIAGTAVLFPDRQVWF